MLSDLHFLPSLNFSDAPAFLSGLPIILQYALVMIIGAVIGSFLSVVVYRLSKGKGYAADMPCLFTLIHPSSHCPQCLHTLRFWENIPVVSYLALRGRCAICQAVISVRYPLLEITSASLAALVLSHFGLTWHGLFAFGFLVVLLALACIDQSSYLLPDTLTLPLLWIGLCINIHSAFTTLEEAVLGAIVGYILLWCVYWIFFLIRKKEGLGYGDFKLLAAIGAWQGVYALPQVLGIASLIGLIVGLCQLVCGRLIEQRLAFGPFLSLSAALTLFMPGFFERFLL